MKWRRLVLPLIWVIVSTTSSVGIVHAQAYSSPNYSVNEVFFGSGGTLSSGSTNYSTRAGVGALGIGQSSSPNFQIEAGPVTTDKPYLEALVNGVSTNLGVLSTAATATANATFSVKDYLSGGYIVQTDSPPPTSSEGHVLTALSSPTAPQVGTEQFGMNLVANTAPITFGANPVQIPNSTFSSGTITAGASGPNGTTVATGYDTANLFTYVNGNIIAASNQSSGETDYTLSYIFNISKTTPAGQYTFNDVLVVTATY